MVYAALFVNRHAHTWLATLCLMMFWGCSTSSEPAKQSSTNQPSLRSDVGLDGALSIEADRSGLVDIEEVVDIATDTTITSIDLDIIQSDGAPVDVDNPLEDSTGETHSDDVVDATIQLDAVGDTSLPSSDGGSMVDASIDSGSIDTAVNDTGPVDTKVCPFGLTPSLINCGFQGVCAGTVKVKCVADQPTCDYTKVPNYEVVELTCDGLDNDCNGATDNNLARPIAVSWPNVGVCKKALKVCDASNGWKEPKGVEIAGYQSVETQCDGLDNDCDGVTDIDITGKPPMSSALGVCSSLSKVCLWGMWLNPNPQQAPNYQAVETLCDGLDNDCDGLTDESLSPPKLPSGGFKVLQSGVCTGAKASCVKGVWVAPDYAKYVSSIGLSGLYEPIEQTCDGLDNDCDGQTDEGLTGPPASIQFGVCAGLRKVCKGINGWMDPPLQQVAKVSLGPEISCDGQDNDCDGKTDEEAICPLWQLGGRNQAGAAVRGDTVVIAAGSSMQIFKAAKLVRQDFRHSQPVVALALSSDGKLLASCSTNEVLRVQSVNDGVMVDKVDAPGKTWRSVSWAPTNKAVAVGDSVGWVRVVPIGSGPGAFAKKLFSGVVRPIRWVQSGSLTGLRVVAAGGNGQVKAIHPYTGVTWTYEPKPLAKGVVTDIAIDKRYAAVSWNQGGVAVFDTKDGATLGATFALTVAAQALSFDEMGRLWVIDKQGDVRRYDPQGDPPSSWKLSWSFVGTSAPGPVVSLDWLPPKILLASGSQATGTLSDKGAWSLLWQGSNALTASLSIQPPLWARALGGPQVYFGDASGPLGSLSPHGSGKVAELALSPNNASTLLSRSQKGALVSWPLPGAKGPLWSVNTAVTGSLAWSPDGSAHWRAQKSQLWRTSVADGKSTLWYSHPKGAKIDAISVSAQHDRLAFACQDSTEQLVMMDLKKSSILWSRDKLVAPRHALAWRPDGKEILASGGSAKLALIDTQQGKTIALLPGHFGYVSALAWMSEGKRFVSASDDGLVRLWRRTSKGAIGEMTSVRHCNWPCLGNGGVVGVGQIGANRWVSLGSDGGQILWSLPPL
ncbi:MAG: hypothetical protein CMH53_01280 [Myxococcales bacterium]|nr:hypothetical protein [Myxococcales bacterium]